MPRWSPQELEDFEKGVEKHGIGKWQKILQDDTLHFHPQRKAKSLSDKYQYNQQQRGGQQLQQKKLSKLPPATTDAPNATSTVSPAAKKPLALTWTVPWSEQNKIKRTRGLYAHNLTASTSSGGNHIDTIPFIAHQSHVPEGKVIRSALSRQESTELEESTFWAGSSGGRTQYGEPTGSPMLSYAPLTRPQTNLIVETTTESKLDSDTMNVPNPHSTFLPNYTHWTQLQNDTVPWYSANASEAVNASLIPTADPLYGDLIESAFPVGDQNDTFNERVSDLRED